MDLPRHHVHRGVHAGPGVLAHGDGHGGHGEPHEEGGRCVVLVLQTASHQHHQEGGQALVHPQLSLRHPQVGEAGHDGGAGLCDGGAPAEEEDPGGGEGPEELSEEVGGERGEGDPAPDRHPDGDRGVHVGSTGLPRHQDPDHDGQARGQPLGQHGPVPRPHLRQGREADGGALDQRQHDEGP